MSESVNINLSGEIPITTEKKGFQKYVNDVEFSPPVSAKVLDEPTVVHMLSPGLNKSFRNYADTVFIPFVHRELATVSRLDIIWDRYDTDSLKNVTREKRGTGQRTRVISNTKIPKGWANFLRVNTNKEEFFHFLALQCTATEFTGDKEFYVTDGVAVLSNSNKDKQTLEPCNHEEADTRIMVHVGDAAAQGHKKIMVRTVDTDVVVLAVSCVSQLPQLEELWVHIGTGKNHQFLPCHAIAASLGPEKADVLPLFHAFSGCDTFSSFAGKGKKSAFEAWNACPTATERFKHAKEGNVEHALPILERFVIAMYDRLLQHIRTGAGPAVFMTVISSRRPWTQFVATENFKVPASVPRLSRRFYRNVEYFQANYLIVFLGLFAYCLITTPLLLIAMVASFFGYRKLTSGPNTWKIGSWELSKTQQYAVAAAGSMAICWFAGAGAVLFWVLGATVTVVALHASFFDAEALPEAHDPEQFPMIEQV